MTLADEDANNQATNSRGSGKGIVAMRPQVQPIEEGKFSWLKPILVLSVLIPLIVRALGLGGEFVLVAVAARIVFMLIVAIAILHGLATLLLNVARWLVRAFLSSLKNRREIAIKVL